MTEIVSYILGAIVLIVGLLGYFMDPILGIFEVDVIHSSIYVALGAILIVMSMYNPSMSSKIVGVVVALVAILGFVPPTSSVLGVVETNMASSILQAIVAIILLAVGFMSGEEEAMPQTGQKIKEGQGQNEDMQQTAHPENENENQYM